MKNIIELVQVVIRAQCKEEYNFIKENGVNTFYMRDIRQNVYGKDWICGKNKCQLLNRAQEGI